MRSFIRSVFRSNTIAFIVPIKEALLRLAKNYTEITEESSYEDVCNDPGLVNEVLRILSLHGKKNGLEKFEIPTKIQLCPEVWMPDSGLQILEYSGFCKICNRLCGCRSCRDNLLITS